MRTPMGGIRRLSDEEMLRIHETTLAILQDPGIKIDLPDYAFQKLEAAGAQVDHSCQRVCLNQELVLETIRQFAGASSLEITEEGTDRPPQPLRLPTQIKGILGSTHGFVFDLDQWRIRPATHDDVRSFMKIRRNLQDVDPNGVGMLPQDVPQEVAYIHRAAMSAKYDVSPSGGANGPDDAPWVTRVLQAAGAWGPDAPPAASVHMQLTGALSVEARVARDMLQAAEAGRLTVILPCGFMGGNHPVTVPGALAQVYAETFGSNTMVRLLADPPNNVFVPCPIGCDHLAMDLRRGAFTGGDARGGTPTLVHAPDVRCFLQVSRREWLCRRQLHRCQGARDSGRYGARAAWHGRVDVGLLQLRGGVHRACQVPRAASCQPVPVRRTGYYRPRDAAVDAAVLPGYRGP